MTSFPLFLVLVCLQDPFLYPCERRLCILSTIHFYFTVKMIFLLLDSCKRVNRRGKCPSVRYTVSITSPALVLNLYSLVFSLIYLVPLAFVTDQTCHILFSLVHYLSLSFPLNERRVFNGNYRTYIIRIFFVQR